MSKVIQWDAEALWLGVYLAVQALQLGVYLADEAL